ncbi:MAG TPA: hypothetical protein VNR11_04055 [Xanthobacteraceae bacterium]|nr:hypothetical protein [Xanthobacteraceae bacterium]
MSRAARVAAQNAIEADPRADKYRRYFAPYLTKSERLIWAGRSDARSTILTYGRVWFVSLPAMVLFWLVLPREGAWLIPFFVALGLTLGPLGAALVAHQTFFGLTERRALFLIHGAGRRRFEWMEIAGAKPWVATAPGGRGTVFIGNVGVRGVRHQPFADGYGNKGFWRIEKPEQVAALAQRIAATWDG